MKKIFIMSAIALSGVAITSCSSTDEEIQKTPLATVATQNGIVEYQNLENDSTAIIITTPKKVFSYDGVDDATNPPKKP